MIKETLNKSVRTELVEVRALGHGHKDCARLTRTVLTWSGFS